MARTPGRRGRATETMETRRRCTNCGRQFTQDVPALYKETADGKTIGPIRNPTGDEKCPYCGSQRLEFVSGPES
jgi:DNA-directed RNA polymerase subunit RPC12/RpoP